MSNDTRAFSGPEFRVNAADIKTGSQAIRARVWSVWRRGNFAGLARDTLRRLRRAKSPGLLTTS
jgi:hypothetical protein